jgi:hypothetical protein
MNRWIRFVAVAVTGLLMTGCVTPATGHDSYSDKPVTSMRAETSEVQTARLVLQLLPRHRILGPYADEALTGCEKAAGSIPATFGSVHRPAATVSEPDPAHHPIGVWARGNGSTRLSRIQLGRASSSASARAHHFYTALPRGRSRDVGQRLAVQASQDAEASGRGPGSGLSSSCWSGSWN